MKLISFSDVGHRFHKTDGFHQVLSGVSFDVEQGEACAIIGPSGSGKSTLLQLMGFLDKVQTGVYRFKGIDVSSCSAQDLAEFRNKEIGFVFQSFNLLPQMTLAENVALPLFYRKTERSIAHSQAISQLRHVGLADRATSYPGELSGGQRQRVAIARALVGNPSIILADEPTGNLDAATGREIVSLLRNLNRNHGVTLFVITHDNDIASSFNRRLRVVDGRVSEEILSTDQS